jgi:hypothetical protein
MGNTTKVALVALLILMVVVIARFVRDDSEGDEVTAANGARAGQAGQGGGASTSTQKGSTAANPATTAARSGTGRSRERSDGRWHCGAVEFSARDPAAGCARAESFGEPQGLRPRILLRILRGRTGTAAAHCARS